MNGVSYFSPSYFKFNGDLAGISSAYPNPKYLGWYGFESDERYNQVWSKMDNQKGQVRAFIHF